MGFFSFLKYTFIIFAAHLATSRGAPFDNRWSRYWQPRKINHTKIIAHIFLNNKLERIRKRLWPNLK
jgi:hypothetical protein